MSGFFSLGSGAIGIGKVDEQHHHHHHHHHLQDQQHDDGIITPYSLYLFKNEEIYTKGFELWQQSYQFQHLHQQPPHYDRSHRRKSSSVSSGTGGGGGGCVDDLNHNATSWNISGGGGGGGGCKVMSLGGYGIGGGSGGGGGGGMNCQDCGNQAKKDCEHMRCRTCCKSRGFHCQTHVKSTWVPAAKRRERQHQLISLTEQQNLGNQQLSLMMRAGGSGGGGGGDSGGDHNPKRLREDHHQHHQQPSIAVAGSGGGGGGGGMGVIPQHHNTCSGLEMSHFPAEVNSPAVFRCVRVSAVDDAEEQLAYQTALNIGGHVFKGILYDHGPEEGTSSAAGAGGGGGGGQLQQLITSGGTTAAATATTSIHPSVNFIDPSSTYPTPFSAFMAGTQFFPPPRS